METRNTDLVFPRKRSQATGSLLGSGVFVFIGIWMVSTGRPGILVPGIVTIAFFGACFLLFLSQSYDRRPPLIIGPDGVTDHSTGISAGFIPWSDIAGFHAGKIQGQDFILVEVKDPEEYLRRGNALQRLLKRLNQRSFGAGICIHTGSIEGDSEELMKILTGALAARDRSFPRERDDVEGP